MLVGLSCQSKTESSIEQQLWTDANAPHTRAGTKQSVGALTSASLCLVPPECLFGLSATGHDIYCCRPENNTHHIKLEKILLHNRNGAKSVRECGHTRGELVTGKMGRCTVNADAATQILPDRHGWCQWWVIREGRGRSAVLYVLQRTAR